MKAVLLHEHGGLDRLQIGEIPTPEPGPGEVRVQLRAAALNHVDLFVREGWPGLELEYPHISGSDGAGDIDAIGAGVDAVQIGDRVVVNGNLSCGSCRYCLAGQDNLCIHWNLLGETVRGTLAEYVVVPAGNVLSLPDTIGYEDAAAASLVFLTAWHSLIVRGRLQAGETVLIVGASGGVNTASLQVAKLAGATVFVVGSSEEKLELARALGADVLINRKEEDWSKAAYRASDRRGVDVVIDNVGKGTMPLSLRAARKGGRILTVGNTGGPKYELDHRYLFAKHLSILGSTMGTRSDFQTVMNLVFDGRLQPVIDRSYPLEDIRAAEARLEAGEQMGKITLVI
ncbi:MAG: zinc-binding dehydrogenase [Anaerolineales bacterium]